MDRMWDCGSYGPGSIPGRPTNLNRLSQYLSMSVKNLFKPTKGRIALFLLLFFVIGALDTNMRLFQNSPLIYNFWSTGAPEFIIYMLLVPYVLSCIVPEIVFYRSRADTRMANLRDYFNPGQSVPKELSQKQTMASMSAFEEAHEDGAAAKSVVKAGPKAKKAVSKKAKK